MSFFFYSHKIFDIVILFLFFNQANAHSHSHSLSLILLFEKYTLVDSRAISGTSSRKVKYIRISKVKHF